MKESQSGIEISQENTVEELEEEIPVARNTKEDLHCTPAMHTRYSSLLGQINWLQSRKQFQQTGCTAQVTASKNSVLATHKTVENNWIS